MAIKTVANTKRDIFRFVPMPYILICTKEMKIYGMGMMRRYHFMLFNLTNMVDFHCYLLNEII